MVRALRASGLAVAPTVSQFCGVTEGLLYAYISISSVMFGPYLKQSDLVCLLPRTLLWVELRDDDGDPFVMSVLRARSYLAGEWEVVGENKEHDGLRQVFLFFVDNRDVSTDTRGRRGGMKVPATRWSWTNLILQHRRGLSRMDGTCLP